jgi:hypothetical protein
MKLLGRTLLGLVVFASVFLSFSALSTEWLSESYPLPNHFGDVVSLLEAEHKSKQLTQATYEVEERCRRKDRISDEMLTGKLTFFEAAAQFRALYADPRSWPDLHSSRPEYDDGAAWCRLVIDWADVQMAYEKSPGQAQVVRQRLEDELREHLRYHCTVELPE